ncbi:MAG TPA: YihA family ribosome biogenesis GTP-binding protein [Candidatus Avimonoglobus intestinipullorum]|uniref:Probable GTP-binding protein EngB n=1 Tax=Candidatus Avimonoglobus intestinipullorum TaxID=2840699 RepID=A0A9D1LWM0_9FIRM|nr:YihA family ribosome biogenesis GTP-binding protein [Candidatus Avimonoglobus intestinipullorum]
MNIHNAELTVSAVHKDQYPAEGLPEFAFVGRSNVGKSSLINKLLNRKALARVSGTPGKTATINFYNIDDTIYLVDLPGYGYAVRSEEEIKKWGRMIEDYLHNRNALRHVILLVDSRHEPTEDDKLMLHWIREHHENAIVIATKTDKLKKRELEKNLHMIWKKLRLGEDDILVPFSTKDDEGKFTVWDMIHLMRQNEM